MRSTLNGVELRTLEYYHRLYPFGLVGTQLQYRTKSGGKWSLWKNVPTVEAKDSPRLLWQHEQADRRQAHREKQRSSRSASKGV
jgi:hypothetical protein